ncbi:MAG: hypothetical protein L0332_23680 [Chloroflexi bacterium]|nr:hypothetical protein [Chloroflexota bacterium]MCI0579472.1 hypothetical protein [Chloroflexota bacterium]MCI0644925.1 hypothetical protein [Chloroflexota bacterium]MCI0729694.1 hypothetical protein [Chloroflexota bacterium]
MESDLEQGNPIRFDQLMDVKSVEAAFHVNPMEDEAAVVSGVFTWPQPDTVVFTSATGLEQQRSYQVRIADTAIGQSNLPLATAVELEVQTVGYLTVSQIIPEGQEVALDSAITVLFNRPVVPLVIGAAALDLPDRRNLSVER